MLRIIRGILQTRIKIIFPLLFTAGIVFPSAAEVFFSDGFEGGDKTSGASPVWSWNNSFDPAKPTGSHMMYGSGDIYEVSSDVAHTGRYSLRLNFDGRNGFCNVCGTKIYTVESAPGGSKFLTDADGNRVTAHSSVLGKQRIIYNRDDSFSKWTWSDLSRALMGEVSQPLRNDMTGLGVVNSNDTLLISNQCGVDGTVGGNINRRSDCDRAINYFKGVQESHLPYGKTLSRRFYLYIPMETVLPEITFKLGYAHFRRPEDDGKEKRVGTAIVISVQRKGQLEISQRSIFGKHTFTPLKIDRDKWYYIEEVWKRESSYLANDAEYWLYAGESGSDVHQPLVHLTGGRLGKLLDMSLHGNWQHFTDVSGYVYFDDIRIATQRSGPVSQDIAPASPASLSAYQVHQ